MWVEMYRIYSLVLVVPCDEEGCGLHLGAGYGPEGRRLVLKIALRRWLLTKMGALWRKANVGRLGGWGTVKQTFREYDTGHWQRREVNRGEHACCWPMLGIDPHLTAPSRPFRTRRRVRVLPQSGAAKPIKPLSFKLFGKVRKRLPLYEEYVVQFRSEQLNDDG